MSRSEKKEKQLDRSTIRRVLKLLGAYRGLVILSLLCAALSTVLTLAVPLLIGNAIDLMLGEIDDLAQVQVNLEKAATAVDLLVTVKNKAVDAYNEIMRMNV